MPKAIQIDNNFASDGAQRSVTFRDKAFKSRTFVFADGSAASVEKSRITVSTTEHIAQLDGHADFERTDAGA